MWSEEFFFLGEKCESSLQDTSKHIQIPKWKLGQNPQGNNHLDFGDQFIDYSSSLRDFGP
jgi:hypothetical protein